MTASAWIMLGVTWTVIAYFTVKYFVMVLRGKPFSETE